MKKRKIKKLTARKLDRPLLIVASLLAVLAIGVATVGFLKPFTLTQQGTSPTFEFIVITPNRLVRVYGNNFTDLLSGDPVSTTLHIGNVKSYTLSRH